MNIQYSMDISDTWAKSNLGSPQLCAFPEIGRHPTAEFDLEEMITLNRRNTSAIKCKIYADLTEIYTHFAALFKHYDTQCGAANHYSDLKSTVIISGGKK